MAGGEHLRAALPRFPLVVGTQDNTWDRAAFPNADNPPHPPPHKHTIPQSASPAQPPHNAPETGVGDCATVASPAHTQNETLPAGLSSRSAASHWLPNAAEWLRAPPENRQRRGWRGGGENGSSAARCIVGREESHRSAKGRHLVCGRTCCRSRGPLLVLAVRSEGTERGRGARPALMRPEPPRAFHGRC